MEVMSWHFSSGAPRRVAHRADRAATALLVTCVLIASTSAKAAASHYSIYAQFQTKAQSGANTQYAPQAIILGQNGYMFGVSTAGGSYGFGGLFSVRPDGLVDSMRDFDTQIDSGYNGFVTPPSLPSDNFTPLTLLADGRFVGVSNHGGNHFTSSSTPDGVAYVQALDGSGFQLQTFYPAIGDFSQPLSIGQDAGGHIYGYAAGGTWSNGTRTSDWDLFSLNLDGSGNRNLFSFTGYSPTSFAVASDGNMYVSLPSGVVLPGSGGAASSGDVVYKVTPAGVGSAVYTLNGNTDGAGIDELVADTHGNIFGSALEGGTSGNGDGIVFKVDSSGNFTVLHSFSRFAGQSQNGYWPNSLVAGSDGNLYGVARTGGDATHPYGTIFRIGPSGIYSVLHTVGLPQADGSNARSLIQTGPRTFSGVVDGGPTGNGAIFKLVVPIQDDLNGTGQSSLIASGPGALTTGTTSALDSSTTIASGYYPAAIGDLNGDGIADIVWTSPNDDLYVWFGGPGGFTPKALGKYPAGWTLISAGDVNGDGMDDLIWLNSSTNQFAYWLMNGATRIGSRIIAVAPGYYPAATGDFNGDGKLDIAWTSSKNDLYIWQGTGSGFTSKYVTTFPAGWRISGRGDLDGDGKDDLVWSYTDGTQWGYWLMNGTSPKAIKVISQPAGLAGYVISGTADYNGDGLTDILWSNGTDTQLWSNQGTCADASGCGFDISSSAAVPSGQKLFNSSLPSNIQMLP